MFLRLFKKIDLVNILKKCRGNHFPRIVMHHIFSIVEHIISSLIRCKLLDHYSDLV